MRTRSLLVLFVCAALAAWVSAQPGNGPTAADYLGMLRTNRGLYEDLTRHALALGDGNTSLDRADECRQVAARLAREVREAVDRKDTDRLVEVSDHLHAVTADGLSTNLTEARLGISPRSPDFPRLREVHQQAYNDLSRTANLVPIDGDLGTSKRAKEAREKLTAAAKRIGPPPGGEKGEK